MLLILINVLRIKLLSVKNGNSMTSLGPIIIIVNSEETLILVRWVYCDDNKVLIRKEDKLHNGNIFVIKKRMPLPEILTFYPVSNRSSSFVIDLTGKRSSVMQNAIPEIDKTITYHVFPELYHPQWTLIGNHLISSCDKHTS